MLLDLVNQNKEISMKQNQAQIMYIYMFFMFTFPEIYILRMMNLYYIMN